MATPVDSLAEKGLACFTGVEEEVGDSKVPSCLLVDGRGKVLEGVVLTLMPRRPSCFTGPRLVTLN